MTPLSGPLRGRVVLVLGAGDPAGRAAALHLAARGAAVVAAGPRLDEVVRTAGLVAAAGGTVRVVEGAAPPLSPAEVLRLAAEALEPPTDAVVCVAAYAAPDEAREAAQTLARLLPAAGRVEVLEVVPSGRERAAAERLALAFASPTASADPSDSDGARPPSEV